MLRTLSRAIALSCVLSSLSVAATTPDAPPRPATPEHGHALFVQAYPGESISRHTIAKAISSYERTMVSKGSDFGRSVGDTGAMRPAAQGSCAQCH